MNIAELRAQIDSVAFGPSPRAGLLALTAHASPVTVIVGAFDIWSDAVDLADDELALLKSCCAAIIAGQWCDKAGEAASVLAELPDAVNDDEAPT